MTKELLQQAHDALITSLAYVDATSAIAEVQGALKAIEQALAQQEQPAQEAVAYELEAVKFANGKKLVYQKPENLASYIKVRTLVYADADPAPTQPAFTQEPPAKTGARIQAIVTSCLGCTHRRYNSGGIYYCEKLGSDLDPRETFHPLCPLQSLSPTQPAQEPVAWYLSEDSNILGVEWSRQKPKYGRDWTPLYKTAPTQPAQEQPAQKPDLWKTQFLTDVMTSAGLLMHGRTDKKLAQRIADGSARWRTELYTHPEQPVQKVSESWTDIVAVNLVREGVNKHKARELAAHFLTLFAPPTQPALSESQITSIAYNCNALPEVITDKTLVDFVRAIEAHCRGGLA